MSATHLRRATFALRALSPLARVLPFFALAHGIHFLFWRLELTEGLLHVVLFAAFLLSVSVFGIVGILRARRVPFTLWAERRFDFGFRLLNASRLPSEGTSFEEVVNEIPVSTWLRDAAGAGAFPALISVVLLASLHLMPFIGADRFRSDAFSFGAGARGVEYLLPETVDEGELWIPRIAAPEGLLSRARLTWRSGDRFGETDLVSEPAFPGIRAVSDVHWALEGRAGGRKFRREGVARLRPYPRPSEIVLRIRDPLGGEEIRKGLGPLEVLPGSSIEVRLAFPKETALRRVFRKEPFLGDLAVRGPEANGSFPASPGRWSFHAVDEKGRTNPDPLVLELSVRPNAAPKVEWIGPPDGTVLPRPDVVRPEFAAEDDLALEAITLRFRSSSPFLPDASEIREREVWRRKPGVRPRSARAQAEWNLSDLDLLPGHRLVAWFEAVDAWGLRASSATNSLRIRGLAESIAEPARRLEALEKSFAQRAEEAASLGREESRRLPGENREDLDRRRRNLEEALRADRGELSSLQREAGEKSGITDPRVKEAYRKLADEVARWNLPPASTGKEERTAKGPTGEMKAEDVARTFEEIAEALKELRTLQSLATFRDKMEEAWQAREDRRMDPSGAETPSAERLRSALAELARAWKEVRPSADATDPEASRSLSKDLESAEADRNPSDSASDARFDRMRENAEKLAEAAGDRKGEERKRLTAKWVAVFDHLANRSLDFSKGDVLDLERTRREVLQRSAASLAADGAEALRQAARSFRALREPGESELPVETPLAELDEIRLSFDESKGIAPEPGAAMARASRTLSGFLLLLLDEEGRQEARSERARAAESMRKMGERQKGQGRRAGKDGLGAGELSRLGAEQKALRELFDAFRKGDGSGEGESREALDRAKKALEAAEAELARQDPSGVRRRESQREVEKNLLRFQTGMRDRPEEKPEEGPRESRSGRAGRDGERIGPVDPGKSAGLEKIPSDWKERVRAWWEKRRDAKVE